MAKSCALLLAVALLTAPAVRAETVVVRAGWQKARAMLTQGEYRPRIALELKSPMRVMVTKGTFYDRTRKEIELKPSTWVKGKFIQANEADLQVLYRGHENSFPPENISRLRLVTRSKNRGAGLLLGIAAGIGAGFLASLGCCFVEGTSGSVELGYVVLIGTPIAVSYLFHKLWGGRGSVVVVLDESTAKAPPSPSQVRKPLPAK